MKINRQVYLVSVSKFAQIGASRFSRMFTFRERQTDERPDVVSAEITSFQLRWIGVNIFERKSTLIECRFFSVILN